ncbi:MAG: hypothetical protein ABF449_10270 [Ethanoligenens sp.]
MNPQSMSYFSLIIIFLMFAGVMRGKVKHFNPVMIWLVPVLLLSMTAEEVLHIPAATPAAQISITLALIIGGCAGLGIGLLRGKSMHFDSDANGMIYRNSYASVIFFTVVLLFKWAVSAFFAGSPFAALLSIALLAVSCGSIVGRRIFITYKAVQLAK